VSIKHYTFDPDCSQEEQCECSMEECPAGEYVSTEDYEQLQAQVDAIRDEYLNHVEATKSPVMVLDAIGWILEQKAAIKGD